MTDEITPQSGRSDSDRKSSGFRTASAVRVDSRLTGGSGVQRSHLRDRKSWLKGRSRGGRTWSQRKAESLSYCPAKVR